MKARLTELRQLNALGMSWCNARLVEYAGEPPARPYHLQLKTRASCSGRPAADLARMRCCRTGPRNPIA